MTDTSDLVERLKDIRSGSALDIACELDDLCQEAATALTAKDKEIEALKKDRDFWKSERDRIRAFLSEGDCLMLESEQAWRARAETAERELDEAIAALTPSADTKAAYIGEFHFEIEDRDEDGEECSRKVTVPWTTIKEIMAAIRDRAARAVIKQGE